MIPTVLVCCVWVTEFVMLKQRISRPPTFRFYFHNRLNKRELLREEPNFWLNLRIWRLPNQMKESEREGLSTIVRGWVVFFFLLSFFLKTSHYPLLIYCDLWGTWRVGGGSRQVKESFRGPKTRRINNECY